MALSLGQAQRTRGQAFLPSWPPSALSRRVFSFTLSTASEGCSLTAWAPEVGRGSLCWKRCKGCSGHRG